ncbi:MAG: YbjN domain-containing protein [Planctomycetes bacterium]|nr:YbjN domain-containing protein [Planctomycetota bacterium]
MNGFVRTPDGAGRFAVGTAEVDVRQDTEQCLVLSAPLRNGYVTKMELLRRQHFIQGPCKFAGNGRGKVLIAEAFLRRSKERLMEAFEAATEGIEAATRLVSCSNANSQAAPGFFLRAIDTKQKDLVERSLDDLGVSAALREDGVWAWSVDTSRLLHRIRVRISEGKENYYVHVEITGDPLGTLLSTESQEAVARFVLEANHSLRFARCSVADVENDSGPMFLAEAVVPITLFDHELAKAMIDSVVVAGEQVRDEINALCQPDVARAYLGMR